MIALLLLAIIAPMTAVAFVAKPGGTRPTKGELSLAVFSGVTWYQGVAITFLSVRAGLVAGLLATLLVSAAVWWPTAVSPAGDR